MRFSQRLKQYIISVGLTFPQGGGGEPPSGFFWIAETPSKIRT
jgi:hypothetical protein